ncbi:MAG: RNase adapter RapZ [Pseudomonadota bacterium]
MTEDTQSENPATLVFVTGPSGAGRSTALNVLEDLGYEPIDNLPLSLMQSVLKGPFDRPLAIGLDVRNREFSINGVLNTYLGLSDDPRVSIDLLFLECRPDVLLRRYSETRRRHPLAEGESLETGIEMEQDLLTPLRHHATVVIDTSELSPHDLRDRLTGWFDPKRAAQMSILVQSFSYKRGIPPGVDLVFDCRFLKNPHWEPSLRGKDGRDDAVRDYVESDAQCAPFFNKLTELIELLLPGFREEGKSYLTIGLGCTGGQHRSVAIAEKLGSRLANQGWQASTRHRELERRARSEPPQVGERM